MIWDEDPRVQQGIWRFFGSSIALMSLLVVVGGLWNRDIEFVRIWFGVLATIGLAFAVAGLLCGLFMKVLFSVPDLWRWLRVHLHSHPKR